MDIIKNINKFITTYYNKYYSKIIIKHTPFYNKRRECIYIIKEYKKYLRYKKYPHILDIPNILMFLLR